MHLKHLGKIYLLIFHFLLLIIHTLFDLHFDVAQIGNVSPYVEEAVHFAIFAGEDGGGVEVVGALSNYKYGKLKGRVVGVHKPLAGACAMADAGNDAWIGHDGACMWPCGSEFGKHMRKAYDEAVRKFGSGVLVELERENGVYTFDWWMPSGTQDINVVAKKQKTEEVSADFRRQDLHSP